MLARRASSTRGRFLFMSGGPSQPELFEFPPGLARVTRRRLLAAMLADDAATRWPSSAWSQPEDIVGGCMLLPDPVVPSANDLSVAARERFFADMVQLGSRSSNPNRFAAYRTRAVP